MTRPPLKWCIGFLVGLAMQSVLRLDELHSRHPGLTPSCAASYSEGAAICLQRHHEHPPKDFKIEHETDHQRSLIATAMWTKPDERCFRAWANEDDATRDGAYGMALAAVEVADGLVAHHWFETQLGGNWYLVPSGSDPVDLEHSILFEVSGISISDDTIIKAALREMVKQVSEEKKNYLPAIAAVVGFSSMKVLRANVR